MLGIAVVGYGYWGPNLVRNFGQVRDAEVRVCCDLRKDRLEAANSTYPSIDLTTEYRDVLANPAVDAIVLATPLSTHFQLARQALESGRHVLIEKPMTASSSEAEQLVELAAAKSLCLMVDHVFVYTGAVQKIKELYDAGELGQILYIDSRRINLGLFRDDVNVLWDLAPHDFSIIDYVLDTSPVGVFTLGSSHFYGGTEDIAHVTLWFPENLAATIQVNWLAPAKEREMIICGTKQMIRYDDVAPDEKIKVYDRGITVAQSDEDVRRTLVSYRSGDVWAPKIDQTEALYKVCTEFVDSASQGRRPLTDGEAGARIVKMLEVASESMRCGEKRQMPNLA